MANSPPLRLLAKPAAPRLHALPCQWQHLPGNRARSVRCDKDLQCPEAVTDVYPKRYSQAIRERPSGTCYAWPGELFLPHNLRCKGSLIHTCPKNLWGIYAVNDEMGAASRRSRNIIRARLRRDLTVPIEMLVIIAISA